MARMFTDEELQEMIIPTTERIKRAVKAGDKKLALELLNKLFADYQYAFDLRVVWDKAFTDYIYENLGGDALYDVWRMRGWKETAMQSMRITKERKQECEGYIESLDTVQLERWIDKEYFQFRHAHDLRIEWETVLMSYVYRHAGPEALWETMGKVTPFYWQHMIDVTVNGTFKEAVMEQVGGLETHGEPLEIMEDDEKVVVWMRPCGSGQYLVDKGMYQEPHNCARCKACHNTWDIEDFPVYCVHAPLQEMFSIKQIGWPVMVNCPLPEERNRPGYEFAKQSCGFAVYKDPNKIPKYVYEKLGFEKPEYIEKPKLWR
ncbi:MAG: hypothetical protein ACI317_04865 [Floccifex porci]|uniref:hypothetical protein n=1 Tax=Floccifex porci TaxID=2606629 RepID=UPI003F038E6D